jgi:hypothetical protein
MTAPAFGGGSLQGHKLTRYVYLDESGIGDPDREPYLVVAGVIVHADIQLLGLEQYLRDMAAEYVPEEKRPGFFFHAKHLWNGTGPGSVFDRATYPRERRLEALQDLCEIPERFDLPIVVGNIHRAKYAAKHGQQVKDFTASIQAVASTVCLISVEKYMRKYWPDEVATLVYENNDEAKKLIRGTHNQIRNTDTKNKVSGSFAEFLPIQKIAETAFFAEKTESSSLQVADAVAHTIFRKLRGDPDVDRFYKPMEKQIAYMPVELMPSTKGADNGEQKA